MTVLREIGVLCTCREEGTQDDIHAIEDAAIAYRDGQIQWVGPGRELPSEYENDDTLSAEHKLVIPGLVDCHTHLCFAGDRIEEHVRRIRGESYLDIAKSGGGIQSTVKATRAASAIELAKKAHAVLSDMAKLGVTTVEAKSGYGLDLENELKLLEVARTLRSEQPLDIVSTVLAAHVVPKEWKHDREGYVKHVIDQILPAVAERELAEFCDVFLEESAFTEGEAERILRAGQQLGLVPKIHADQLSDGGGGRLAAKLFAVSADHLEHASDEALAHMAEASVVGVTLPLASLYTFEPPLDARRLLKHGVSVAVATDYNPGTAPSYSMPLSLLLACTLNRLTPREALKGATIHAARALRREHEVGSIEAGKFADFTVLDAHSPESYVMEARPKLALATVKRGRVIHGALREASP